MQYTKFLTQYKNYIIKNNPLIIWNVKEFSEKQPQVSKREDGSYYVIRVFDEIEDIIKKINHNYKNDYFVVNSHNSKSIDPGLFSLTKSTVFMVDRERKEIKFTPKENGTFSAGGYWYLVKATAYFTLRNCGLLVDKFENNNFSKVDNILLNGEKVESEVSTKVDELLEKTIYDLDTFQQSAAIKAVNSKDIAIIKGPPGTGKTHIINRIIEYYNMKGTNVIFASSLHTALDSLMSKINQNVHLMDATVKRSSSKANSVMFSNTSKVKPNNPNKGNIYLTTFASYILHDEFEGLDKEKTILIIDEASAVSLFDVYSKTQFASKVIIVGDNAQLYPIFDEDEKRYFDDVYREEYRYFHIQSLFDALYKINNGSISLLKNNYRSDAKIVDAVNFFYGNELNVVSDEKGDIEIISPSNSAALRKALIDVYSQYNDKDTLWLTYFKDNIKTYNDIIGTDKFVTAASVQGIEANNVVYVMSTNHANSLFPIDYRSINVSISRARKKLIIINVADLLNTTMIKKDENGKFMQMGRPISFGMVLEKQNSFSSNKYTIKEIDNKYIEDKKARDSFILLSSRYSGLSSLSRAYFEKIQTDFDNRNVRPGYQFIILDKLANHQSGIYGKISKANVITESLKYPINLVAFGDTALEILTTYLIDGLSINAIATQMNVDDNTISATLYKYLIKPGNESRKKLTIDEKDEIKQLVNELDKKYTVL